jgi:uncharacterized cupin superfamily protein
MKDRAAELARQLIRNHDDAPLDREEREPLYDTRCARLATGTAAAKLGASIDILPPGKRGCPYHFHHAEEEMFIVLEGEGTLRVAGELLPIRQGDVIFIPPGPEYPHQIINSSASELKYLSISTREPVEICEYPDSGKVGAWAGARGPARRELIARPGESLDYWDGEP